MKTIKFLTTIMLLATMVFSCKPDKKAELAKLQKQHDKISEQIKKLQDELAVSDSTSPAKNLKQVAIMDLKPSTFQHFIEVQGRLDGEENVDVYPEAMGVAESVTVRSGDVVSKGQVLARLNDAAVREQLKALETQYQFAKETYEKQERLWNQKIGSEMQYLQSKTQKEALESQLAGVRKQRDMFAIKSPIDGTVEDVALKIGQTASPQLPAFRVLNFSTIKVKADVAEAYASKIQVGDAVTLYFPDLNREVKARVSSASRYINPINRTFQVEVRFDAPKAGFKANMVTILKITDYIAANAAVIPVNFIQTDPTGSFIYIAENKGDKTVAKKVFIKQGQSYNGMIEITEGLKPGDKIISSGYMDLEEGEAVKI